MFGGYMGNVPWIDLSTGRIETLTFDDATLRDFIGGYGIGARLIYEKQKGGVDPLARRASSVSTPVRSPALGRS